MGPDGSPPPSLNRRSGGGSIGEHPARSTLPVFVGPSTGDEFNTIRDPLIVIACWRMDDIRFEFDSSFIRPDAADEFTMLWVLRRAHPNAPLSLFGHADPVGEDEYNKRLSGRRATAVYAVLVRDVDKWESLYNNREDHWGLRAVQIMLDRLGFPPGNTEGNMDDGTRDALRNFRSGGRNDEPTRKALYQAYMDSICTDTEGNPYRLAAGDFLLRGAESNGRGDYQGCGEFNPVLMFSQAEDDAYRADSDKTARNEDNAPNRRVDGYLFRPGTTIEAGRWPCPGVDADTTECRSRFYSDSRTRRSFQANRRTHAVDNDTFACRFFDLISDRSPCQAGRGAGTLRVIFQLYPGLEGADADRGIAGVPYTVRVIGESQSSGNTAADGSVTINMPANGTAVLEIFGTQYIIANLETIQAIGTMTGVQQRFVMLGFEADLVDGTVDVQTDESILRVQGGNNLNTDGESGFDLNSGTISTPFQNALRAWAGE